MVKKKPANKPLPPRIAEVTRFASLLQAFVDQTVGKERGTSDQRPYGKYHADAVQSALQRHLLEEAKRKSQLERIALLGSKLWQDEIDLAAQHVTDGCAEENRRIARNGYFYDMARLERVIRNVKLVSKHRIDVDNSERFLNDNQFKFFIALLNLVDATGEKKAPPGVPASPLPPKKYASLKPLVVTPGTVANAELWQAIKTESVGLEQADFDKVAHRLIIRCMGDPDRFRLRPTANPEEKTVGDIVSAALHHASDGKVGFAFDDPRTRLERVWRWPEHRKHQLD